MATWQDLVVVVLTVYSLYLFLRRSKKNCAAFPEPRGIPIFGHMFFLGKNPAEKFLEWKKSCGPVFQLRFANTKVLVLNDKSSISDCFAKVETAGRLSFKLIDWHLERGGMGFMFNEGHKAEDQRNFLMAAFRKYGVMKNKMEDRFSEEAQELIKLWKSKSGEYFDLSGSCSMFVLNSMWQIIGSKRYDYQEACQVLHNVGMVQEADTWFSKLTYLAPKLVALFSNIVEERLKAGDDLVDSQIKLVEEHKQSREPNNPRDVIDMFLDKVEATKDVNSVFHPSYGVLAPALRDLLMATIEAMSITLEWFIIYGIQYPWMVEHIYEEIVQVIGTDRKPRLEDRDEMPYMQACIFEILRITSVAPLGIPHSAMEDSTFRGCEITKGTIILSNLWAVHHDPETWEDPEEFRPSRFLTPEGDLSKEAKGKVLPFSSGKRACIGQAIVEDELFLVLTNIYQEFVVVSQKRIDSMEGVYGLTYRPPYGIKIRPLPRA